MRNKITKRVVDQVRPGQLLWDTQIKEIELELPIIAVVVPAVRFVGSPKVGAMVVQSQRQVTTSRRCRESGLRVLPMSAFG
jgi:hypothetical protein